MVLKDAEVATTLSTEGPHPQDKDDRRAWKSSNGFRAGPTKATKRSRGVLHGSMNMFDSYETADKEAKRQQKTYL